MTKDEIEKLHRRARYVARKSGYPELADDFAQEIFIGIAKGWHQPIDLAFVDFLRGEYGNTGTKCGDARSRGIHTQISLDEPIRPGISDVCFADVIAAPEPDSRSLAVAGGSSYLFGGREAEIYTAYFVDQESEFSIGQRLGVTESRVCQILGGMKKKITGAYETQRLWDRYQEDPGFTRLEIDWIRI